MDPRIAGPALIHTPRRTGMSDKGLDYGVIGNGSSAALISKTGSLDWACLPNFGSPAVFARLLDPQIGGYFQIELTACENIRQEYLKNTNILRTVYKSATAEMEILDFMPRYHKSSGAYACPSEIIRLLRPVSGKPTIKAHYSPSPGYAQFDAKQELEPEFIKTFTTKGAYESLYLYTNLDKKAVLQEEEISLDKPSFFLISYNQKLNRIDWDWAELEYLRTRTYWLDWCSRTSRYEQYQDEILRSALVLKLLSYQKSGAIIAAVSTSLPETAGEVRNWDYRYCWIRDSSMIIQVLFKLGHRNGAKRFLQFILNAVPYKDEKIQIMYGINGEKKLSERTLDWLSGYKNSRPVRVGNAAYFQKQNDIYGVLLDVILKNFEYFRQDMENAEEIWTIVRGLVRSVIRTWKDADMGIWEFRSQRKHFVFSKVLCWVALDRGSRIAALLNRTEYAQTWAKIANTIKKDIHTKGWKEDLGAFTQAYENQAMDAANLLMATYGFIDAKDPRFVSTVKRTQQDLSRNGLMYRYRNQDDFGLPSSSFTVCTFWLIKALHQIGEADEAKAAFEALLKESNHLGLFSEDMDFESRELLGNFPQGYSHLALIDTALTLMENT